jgi:hypothetical protein
MGTVATSGKWCHWRGHHSLIVKVLSLGENFYRKGLSTSFKEIRRPGKTSRAAEIDIIENR